MNRTTGLIVIVVMVVLLAIVASRAFDERAKRQAAAKPVKLLEVERKKAEEVPLWRQR